MRIACAAPLLVLLYRAKKRSQTGSENLCSRPRRRSPPTLRLARSSLCASKRRTSPAHVSTRGSESWLSDEWAARLGPLCPRPRPRSGDHPETLFAWEATPRPRLHQAKRNGKMVMTVRIRRCWTILACNELNGRQMGCGFMRVTRLTMFGKFDNPDFISALSMSLRDCFVHF